MQNNHYEEPLVRKHRDSPTFYTYYQQHIQHLKTLQTKQTINKTEPLKLLSTNTKHNIEF